jgi:Fur family ferric uptake transcriptional regulator
MDIHVLYKTIKDKGGRLTKTRKAILETLANAHCLMSEADIRNILNKKSIVPNRSTLFRELKFLVTHAIVVKNSISGTDYYEIPHDHHHHLVCLGCNSIDKVEIGNHLEKQEQEIAKKNDFTITNHSLEFYGYCKDCEK